MERIKEDLVLDGAFTSSRRTENGYALTVTAEGAAIQEARVVYRFDFQAGDALFLNGYQSWTLSAETGIGDFDKSLRWCPKALDCKFGFSRYGDNHFYPRSFRRGMQHGYSYAYVRRGETYFFFGSLCEDSGFTRILFDTNENTVSFEKDCIGRRVKGSYPVFDLWFCQGSEAQVFDGWFQALGIRPPTSKKLTGYSSWYNYYQNITEEILTRDLEGMGTLPIQPDLFQIDDGYETFVGDWLSVDPKKFPNGLETVVEKIRSSGYRAGLWLAPFVCESKSALFREHSDWLLRDAQGNPVYGGCNWSGMYALDYSHPQVQEHIRRSIQRYRDMGFTLFKLDFLYAVCMLPRPDKTRGEIMAEAMAFLRQVCGDCTILACGVPLASAFGRAEFCRIGMDMTLDWNDKPFMRLFHSERPSTRNTMLNTLFRRQLSGRAFWNDPDVFLLRQENIQLSQKQKENLAKLNCLLGGVLFTSDNFSRYTPEMREMYREAIALRDATFISCHMEGGQIQVSYALHGDKRTICWRLSGD